MTQFDLIYTVPGDTLPEIVKPYLWMYTTNSVSYSLAHMQKHNFLKFKTSWCTQTKHFLED